jgi:hypothetical protein
MTKTLKKLIIKKSDKTKTEILEDNKDNIKKVIISNKSTVIRSQSMAKKNKLHKHNHTINT